MQRVCSSYTRGAPEVYSSCFEVVQELCGKYAAINFRLQSVTKILWCLISFFFPADLHVLCNDLKY